MAAALYLIAAWLLILFTAIKIAVMLAIGAAILFVVFKVLAGASESTPDSNESNPRTATYEREVPSRSTRNDDDEGSLSSARRVTDVDKYRRGYERAKADIERTRHERLSDVPEMFVKGAIGLPGEAVKDFFRSADEDRGYRDAMDGREFDPS